MTILTLKSPKFGMSGEFRAVLRNPDESVAYDTGWGDNLITDLGEIQFCVLDVNNPFTRCYIGNSATAAAVGQTAMPSFVASATSPTTSTPSSTNVGAPNYEKYTTKTWRFNAGVGTGTIQDMGIGSTTNSVAGLFARHVLTSPVVKAANQSLDVSYRFTLWPSLIESEVTGVLIGGVNYTCKTSIYNLTNNTGGDNFGVITFKSGSTNYWTVYNGIKATPTGTAPSGTTAVMTGTFRSNYNQVGAQMDALVFYPLNAGNTANNIIRTATARIDPGAFYLQTEFTATDGPGIGDGIPKDLERELTLNWRLNWGRRP